MITTVLADDPLVVPPAVAFATGLTGGPPARVLRRPIHLGHTDVVVAASRVWDNGPLLPSALAGAEVELAGTVAFAMVLGGTAGTAGWPLVAALEAAGAWCPAPALQVAGPPQDPAAAILSYCRYWRPATAALVAAGWNREPAA